VANEYRRRQRVPSTGGRRTIASVSTTRDGRRTRRWEGAVAMLHVTIGRMSADELPEAGRVLGAAFTSSPLEQAVRGTIDERQRRGLVIAYTATCRLPGQVSVAWSEGRIVGSIRWVESPRCQLRAREKLARAPTAISAFGRNLPRALTWVTAWSKRDPSEPHLHLGPIGVTPDLQGHGIGSQMLAVYCDRLDAARDAGYLETDKPENVRLYERFGFEVVDEAVVLGVRNWFMWRSTRRSPVGT
jgi:GNAT superfamily N-acetyltransferase